MRGIVSQLDEDLIEDELAGNDCDDKGGWGRGQNLADPGLILKCVAPRGPTMTIPWSRILPDDEDRARNFGDIGEQLQAFGNLIILHILWQNFKFCMASTWCRMKIILFGLIRMKIAPHELNESNRNMSPPIFCCR